MRAAGSAPTCPTTPIVASWDAGVLGAFTDQPVVNLDGVVNSGEFADAMASGRGGAFLRAEGVTHIANHGDLIDGDDPWPASWWTRSSTHRACVSSCRRVRRAALRHRHG